MECQGRGSWSGLSAPPLASASLGAAASASWCRGFHGEPLGGAPSRGLPQRTGDSAVGGGSLETSLKLWQAGALPGEPRAPGNICSDAQKSVEAAAQEQGELPQAAEATAGRVLGRMTTQTAVEGPSLGS